VIRFLVARLKLADGTEGEGYLLAFHFSTEAIRGALADVRALAMGREADATRGIRPCLRRGVRVFWQHRPAALGPGHRQPRDVGCTGAPVRPPRLAVAGGKAQRVPTYGSGGWLSIPSMKLLAEASGYVRRGFTAVKLKVGSADLERDVERITKVRDAWAQRSG